MPSASPPCVCGWNSSFDPRRQPQRYLLLLMMLLLLLLRLHQALSLSVCVLLHLLLRQLLLLHFRQALQILLLPLCQVPAAAAAAQQLSSYCVLMRFQP
jgi:hypothetical protein